jgi:hypothetical protein
MIRRPRWGDRALPERFWDKARRNVHTGCWEWTGRLDKDGYAERVHVSGSGSHRVRMSPQRWAYTVLVGPIDDETLNHDCYVRNCVNPGTEHAATPMSLADNVREGKARITHCPHGHEYTDDNTILVGPLKNRRQCRACTNGRSRAYWHETRKTAQKEQRRERGYRGGFDETSTCRHGHLRIPENVYIDPRGKRSCRACRNLRSAAHNKGIPQVFVIP